MGISHVRYWKLRSRRNEEKKSNLRMNGQDRHDRAETGTVFKNVLNEFDKICVRMSVVI